MIAVHHIERSLADLHGDIHNMFNPALIHDGEDILGFHGVEMIVIVDYGETGSLYPMHLTAKSGVGMKITQAQVNLCSGAYHVDKFVLGILLARLLHGTTSIDLHHLVTFCFDYTKSLFDLRQDALLNTALFRASSSDSSEARKFLW
jgi:hypothetical protein